MKSEQSKEPQGLIPGEWSPKKAYRKPVLIDLGDLRTVTMAQSPGQGESGNSFNFKYPV